MTTESTPGPVLILAPFGRDAAVAADVLEKEGLRSVVCRSMEELCEKFEEDAGVLLITEESIDEQNSELLKKRIRSQEAWSDIPIIFFTARNKRSFVSQQILDFFSPSGNISFLERPFRIVTFVSTVRVALRARRRQYEVKELLARSRESILSLEQEREVRERFVLALGHDLRNPLTAAKMSAQILARRETDTAGLVRGTSRIVNSIDRAERMIRDLLDANRIRAGQKLQIKAERCDLNEHLPSMIEDLVAIHGNRFELMTEGKLEGFWDYESLRRAFENLATNAIKYGSDYDPITISVIGSATSIEVQVHNRGLPISAEDQAGLFMPFRRTASAQAGHQKGWGLGLTLVRGTAEAHGGSVRVVSNVEQGTTFIMTLPLDAREFIPAG